MIYMSYKLISGINYKFGMSDNRQPMFRPPILPKKIPPPKPHTELTGGWGSLTAVLGDVLKRIFPRSPTE
jgi:hypothetical protein